MLCCCRVQSGGDEGSWAKFDPFDKAFADLVSDPAAMHVLRLCWSKTLKSLPSNPRPADVVRVMHASLLTWRAATDYRCLCSAAQAIPRHGRPTVASRRVFNSRRNHPSWSLSSTHRPFGAVS